MKKILNKLFGRKNKEVPPVEKLKPDIYYHLKEVINESYSYGSDGFRTAGNIIYAVKSPIDLYTEIRISTDNVFCNKRTPVNYGGDGRGHNYCFEDDNGWVADLYEWAQFYARRNPKRREDYFPHLLEKEYRLGG